MAHHYTRRDLTQMLEPLLFPPSDEVLRYVTREGSRARDACWLRVLHCRYPSWNDFTCAKALEIIEDMRYRVLDQVYQELLTARTVLRKHGAVASDLLFVLSRTPELQRGVEELQSTTAL